MGAGRESAPQPLVGPLADGGPLGRFRHPSLARGGALGVEDPFQYAHARIASIERKATEPALDGTSATLSLDGEPDLSLLTHDSEETLVKTLLAFPGEVRLSAEARTAHRLAGFLREIATAFNAFYRDCRIVGEPTALATARLHLAHATRQTLANGLTILGVDAPEQM